MGPVQISFPKSYLFLKCNIISDFICYRDPTKTLNFRRRGSLEGNGANLMSTKHLVNQNSLQIPMVRSQQHQGESNPPKINSVDTDSLDIQQNSVIVDNENSGNWPLVKSGVFVDWTNNIQLNAKVKHN